MLPILVAAFLSAGVASQPPSSSGPATGRLCAPFDGVKGKHEWIPGDHTVLLVSAQHQGKVLRRLSRGAIEEVSEPVARTMVAKAALPHVAHYYLARIDYIGDARPGTLPAHVLIGDDIDRQGVAYVTSFVLSRSQATTEAAAILTSPIPLKRMVSICSGAK